MKANEFKCQLVLFQGTACNAIPAAVCPSTGVEASPAGDNREEDYHLNRPHFKVVEAEVL